MLKTKSFLALTLTAGLALTACGGGGGSKSGGTTASGKPLKIGVVYPASGVFAPEGEEVKRGYELAVEKAGGKVAGRPIQLVYGDAFKPEDAIAEVNRLGSRENVDMLLGTYASSTSIAASEAAARLKLTYMETHAITDTLTDRGLPNYFRVGARAMDFANTSAKLINDSLAPKLGKKVFVEHEDGPYGTSVAATQDKELKAGGATVTDGAHKAAATDVTDSVLAAKRANPDVWLLTGYAADLTLLLRTAIAQNFHPKATVLTGAGDTKALYTAIGAKDLTDTFVVAYSSAKVNPKWAPGNAEFYSSYKKKYNADPLGSVANVAYTGMDAVLKLVEAAKGDVATPAVAKAAAGVDIPFGGEPIGWGLKLDDKQTNTRIRCLAVQWRADGTTPAVFPAEAAVAGETIKLPTG
ncbi:MAG: ABC transporter substrate-binding protein [Mycobacteriales bacterium]